MGNFGGLLGVIRAAARHTDCHTCGDNLIVDASGKWYLTATADSYGFLCVTCYDMLDECASCEGADDAQNEAAD